MEKGEKIKMKLTRNQFEILTFIESNGKKKYSQRNLAEQVSLSLGTTNKILNELLDSSLIKYDEKNILFVTEQGYEVLEQYKVKKAIILAAGFGSRLAPVTLSIPKPLIKVNGHRMISTVIEALLDKGISDITIVRGYLKEQFDVLKSDFPTIKFVDNELFNRENNISSLIKVVDKIDSCYICEADLLLSNPSIIKKYEFASNYLATKVDETDDWCFKKVNGYISNYRKGGQNCYQAFGISFWSKDDSIKLQESLKKVYAAPSGKEKFWESAALTDYKNEFKIEIKMCKKEDIVEVDNFYELVALDKSYENFKGHEKF